MKKFLSKSLFFSGLIFAIAGCNIDNIPDLDNTYLPEYNGDISILLVRDTLVVNDFLEEVISDSNAITTDADQGILFRYETQVDFGSGSDFVKVDSFSNSKYIASPINFFYTTPIDTTLYFEQDIVFNFKSSNEEEIDSVYFNSGTFRMQLNSGFPGEVTYSYITNSFREIENGTPISTSSFVATTTPPAIDVQEVDLNGYKSYLTSESDSNKFVIQVYASVYLEAGTTLTGNEYLNFQLDIVDPEFDAVFGYFGQDTIDIEAKRISLGLFSDFTGSGIEFEYPQIVFNIDNSFGIPVHIDFSKAYAQYSDQPDLLFTGEVADAPLAIPAPSIENYGSVASGTQVIDVNNSNLREMLSSSPDRLVLPLVGYSNLESTDGNFVTNSSLIDINAVIELPLSLRMEGFEYESEVELSGLEDLTNTKELTLIFTTVNELPFSGEIDLYFLDEDSARFDSLTSIDLFEAPLSYDENGKVTEAFKKTKEITLDESKIQSLTTASSLSLVTRINTFGSGSAGEDVFVTIYADYKMMTTLGIRGKVAINLND